MQCVDLRSMASRQGAFACQAVGDREAAESFFMSPNTVEGRTEGKARGDPRVCRGRFVRNDPTKLKGMRRVWLKLGYPGESRECFQRTRIARQCLPVRIRGSTEFAERDKIVTLQDKRINTVRRKSQHVTANIERRHDCTALAQGIGETELAFCILWAFCDRPRCVFQGRLRLVKAQVGYRQAPERRPKLGPKPKRLMECRDRRFVVPSPRQRQAVIGPSLCRLWGESDGPFPRCDGSRVTSQS